MVWSRFLFYMWKGAFDNLFPFSGNSLNIFISFAFNYFFPSISVRYQMFSFPSTDNRRIWQLSATDLILKITAEYDHLHFLCAWWRWAVQPRTSLTRNVIKYKLCDINDSSSANLQVDSLWSERQAHWYSRHWVSAIKHDKSIASIMHEKRYTHFCDFITGDII